MRLHHLYALMALALFLATLLPRFVGSPADGVRRLCGQLASPDSLDAMECAAVGVTVIQARR